MNKQKAFDWLPDYTTRRSKRAKRLSLSISRDKGLEVVLPLKCSERHVVPFIQEHRQWVEKHLAKAVFNPTKEDAEALPHSLRLAALDETWAIDYVTSDTKPKISVFKAHQELIVTGDITDTIYCKWLLLHWIKRKARRYLSLDLEKLSTETGLNYAKFSLRGQKSRWGSCSEDKNISLNYKLIFFPADIVRYVIIHELCHTVHLNHSQQFWQLVGHFLPDYHQLKKQLKEEARFLPRWINLI
ncbi:MAG: SprT family zinc-dependent metalloprotease [Pseudomonadota bacterium]